MSFQNVQSAPQAAAHRWIELDKLEEMYGGLFSGVDESTQVCVGPGVFMEMKELFVTRNFR